MTSPCGPQWALGQFRLSRGTMTQPAKESGFPGLFSGGHLPGNSARLDGHAGCPAVAPAPRRWFSLSGEHQAHLEDVLEQIPEPHSPVLIQRVQLEAQVPRGPCCCWAREPLLWTIRNNALVPGQRRERPPRVTECWAVGPAPGPQARCVVWPPAEGVARVVLSCNHCFSSRSVLSRLWHSRRLHRGSLPL